MNLPLNYNFFSNKTDVWVKFLISPNDQAEVSEFNEEGLVVFGIFYKYEDLMMFAQWSEDRINWTEFYTTI